jgi:G3E family GTPase
VSGPVPVWVVTGPLGSGKTTILSRLLADKPPEEHWVVLLNEFTDAGIDALTVASAARGVYDVRLVPGGCLCCAGEADFRRTLQELLAPGATPPARILVEPSGIGHPAGIVEELLAHEAAGRLVLEGVLGLVDATTLQTDMAASASASGGSEASRLDERSELARASAEIADVLALAKGDLATPAQHAAFERYAEGLFPTKRAAGPVEGGRLPPALLAALAGEPGDPRRTELAERAAPTARPQAHVLERAVERARLPSPVVVTPVGPPGLGGERREVRHLGRHGARWRFPAAVCFSEARVLALLGALPGDVPGIGRPERVKAVLRVGEDEWLLAQRVGDAVTLEPTAWRRDNRIEVQLAPGEPWHPEAWDALWLRACRA